MNKHFPCWVCKGRGHWIEPVTDEGQGPTEYCEYCEGKGVIEIGGIRHMEIVAERIAMDIIKYNKSSKLEWSYNELQELGKKALNLIQ